MNDTNIKKGSLLKWFGAAVVLSLALLAVWMTSPGKQLSTSIVSNPSDPYFSMEAFPNNLTIGGNQVDTVTFTIRSAGNVSFRAMRVTFAGLPTYVRKPAPASGRLVVDKATPSDPWIVTGSDEIVWNDAFDSNFIALVEATPSPSIIVTNRAIFKMDLDAVGSAPFPSASVYCQVELTDNNNVIHTIPSAPCFNIGTGNTNANNSNTNSGAGLTRAQLAQYIYTDFNIPASSCTNPFTDIGNIPDIQQTAISALYAAGLTVGTSSTMFSPQLIADKWQTSAMMGTPGEFPARCRELHYPALYGRLPDRSGNSRCVLLHQPDVPQSY